MNVNRMKNSMVQVIMEFSVPSIIAMVLTSMITIVDGFFIGNYVGKEGLAAVNLGLPVLYLYLALGVMLAVGGIAIFGMSFGAGDMKKCNDVFNQTMLVTCVITTVLSILCYLLFEPIMQVLHAQGEVAVCFRSYYKIMLLVFPMMIANSAFGMFIRGEGNPQFFMKASIVNVIANIVLDYVFVKWLHFGIEGIAFASLIAVVLELLLLIYFVVRKSQIYKFQRFHFSKEVMKSMIFNGSSEFINEISMCISMYAYNWVILRYVGVDGVAAFTIVGYASYLFSMILIGFGQGVSPLISFAYGAKEQSLSQGIRRKTNLFVFLVGVFFMVVMLLGASWYSNAFVKSETVATMAQSGIIIFVFSFLFTGINTITSFYFTSIGRAMESAVISSSRGFVVLLICIFLFPALWGMTGVWLVGPLTEAVTILISFFFIRRSDRQHAQMA